MPPAGGLNTGSKLRMKLLAAVLLAVVADVKPQAMIFSCQCQSPCSSAASGFSLTSNARRRCLSDSEPSMAVN